MATLDECNMVKKKSKRKRAGRQRSNDTHMVDEYSQFSWIPPPWCQVPAWSFQNHLQAENCGYASGRVVANYLSVLVTIGGVVAAALVGTGSVSAADKSKSTLFLGAIVLGVIVILVLLKIGLPRVSRYYSGYQYERYQAKVKSLISSGMSKTKAMNLMQKEYLQEMQNRGMMESASIISQRR